jgi:hypothetical protein
MNGPDIGHITPLIPYGDIAEPSDLDGLILYLASNSASKYVTGSNFTIDGGNIARINSGDMMLVDGLTGRLEVLVPEAEFNAREAATMDMAASYYGMGREMFGALRSQLTGAEQGACSLFTTEEHLHG